MRSAKWKKEWVVGFYATPDEAERFIEKAGSEGIPEGEFFVLGPETMHKKLGGVQQEERHPERRWVVIGAVCGFLLGSIGGHFLLDSSELTGSATLEVAMALVRGFGGALVGGIFGLIASGSDTSLNALYEESGVEGKIMIAIHCDPTHPEEIEHAELLMRKSGVVPLEHNHTHGTKQQHAPSHH